MMYRPQIELLRKNYFENIGEQAYAALLSQKLKMKELIYKTIPPPQSSVLAATLLGDRSAWSDEFQDKLNRTGLTHITAISGQHVVILSAMLLPLLFHGLW